MNSSLLRTVLFVGSRERWRDEDDVRESLRGSGLDETLGFASEPCVVLRTSNERLPRGTELAELVRAESNTGLVLSDSPTWLDVVFDLVRERPDAPGLVAIHAAEVGGSVLTIRAPEALTPDVALRACVREGAPILWFIDDNPARFAVGGLWHRLVAELHTQRVPNTPVASLVRADALATAVDGWRTHLLDTRLPLVPVVDYRLGDGRLDDAGERVYSLLRTARPLLRAAKVSSQDRTGGFRPTGIDDGERAGRALVEAITDALRRSRPAPARGWPEVFAPWTNEEPPGAGLVGEAPLTRELRRKLAQVRVAGGHVLLWGESGTGKTAAAEAFGEPAGGPVRRFDDHGVVGDSAGAELFDRVPGVHASATLWQGLFRSLEGGTLFLDELQNVEPRVQEMLKAAMDGNVRAGAAQGGPVRTRVVAAVNKPPEALVTEGRLVHDLMSRFTHIITLPPLRERLEDLAVLARVHLGKQPAGYRPGHLHPGAITALLAAEWREGNVRALQAALDHATASGASPLRREHLPLALAAPFGEPEGRRDVTGAPPPGRLPVLDAPPPPWVELAYLRHGRALGLDLGRVMFDEPVDLLDDLEVAVRRMPHLGEDIAVALGRDVARLWPDAERGDAALICCPTLSALYRGRAASVPGALSDISAAPYRVPGTEAIEEGADERRFDDGG